ncbi:MAG: hypothetical protein P1V97_33450 [Planctomycetota bacterium]|nr:hypothetical protein [Planctomycetota bacterium]
MRNFRAILSILLASIAFVGCTESSDRDVPSITQPPPVSEVVFTENEPNDPNNPQFLGNVDGNTSYIADGSLAFNDNAQTDDEFDSFTVTASGAQSLNVIVQHDAGVDIDLAIVDPVTGNILTELGDGLTSPESISLSLVDGQTVAIEVEAFSGSGNYKVFIGSSK